MQQREREGERESAHTSICGRREKMHVAGVRKTGEGMQVCVCYEMERGKCDLATGGAPLQRHAVGAMFASPAVPPGRRERKKENRRRG